MRMVDGHVEAVMERRAFREIVRVRLAGGESRLAVHYPAWWGKLEVGDAVFINIEAVELGLGTGGYDFVLAVRRSADRLKLHDAPPGDARGRCAREHLIMKNRYTPLQFPVPAAEMSAATEPLRAAETPSPGTRRNEAECGDHRAGERPVLPEAPLRGRTVVILPLHSMLPIVARWIKRRLAHLRVAYIMTEAAALPAWVSDHLIELKDDRTLDEVITAGAAFGGTREAVNRYSALVLAAERLNAELILIGPGPGSVGVGDALAHSGLDAADSANAVYALGGAPLVVPRMSSADPRPRHFGLSHHTIAALTLTLAPVTIVMPVADDVGDDEGAGGSPKRGRDPSDGWRRPEVRAALDAAWIRLEAVHRRGRRHRVVPHALPPWEDVRSFFDAFPVKSMGRTFQLDPLYFAAATLSAEYWVYLWQKKAPAQSTLP